jgi:2-polyprenyl-6-methoxyphenol hydroxylase-like FAD-dependent oxidoreductase
MPLDQTWKPLSNLTMLGDAAHLMPPFAGEGVNMAMQDASELSECLCSDQFKDIVSAIAAYEIQMRKHASEATKQSLDNTYWMHSPKAIDTMLELFNHLNSILGE